jgi:hypothetical protein
LAACPATSSACAPWSAAIGRLSVGGGAPFSLLLLAWSRLLPPALAPPPRSAPKPWRTSSPMPRTGTTTASSSTGEPPPAAAADAGPGRCRPTVPLPASAACSWHKDPACTAPVELLAKRTAQVGCLLCRRRPAESSRASCCRRETPLVRAQRSASPSQRPCRMCPAFCRVQGLYYSGFAQPWPHATTARRSGSRLRRRPGGPPDAAWLPCSGPCWGSEQDEAVRLLTLHPCHGNVPPCRQWYGRRVDMGRRV